MSRSGVPVRTRMRSPRFRAKDVSTCMGAPTARGSSSASHLRGEDVAFRPAERRQHLEIRPVSQLNTQPVVSPVNASSWPSRAAPASLGPARLARPYAVEDLHLLSFASFPGALQQWVNVHGLSGIPSNEKDSRRSPAPCLERRERQHDSRGILYRWHGAWRAARDRKERGRLRCAGPLLPQCGDLLDQPHRRILGAGQCLACALR